MKRLRISGNVSISTPPTEERYSSNYWPFCVWVYHWLPTIKGATRKVQRLCDKPKTKFMPGILYICTNHHHHVVLVARISLTLSRHLSLSFIASGRSSGQHSCWMYVRAGHPAFARPCVGVHKSTSLMSSSLLLQQCPACLVRLTWIVFVIGGRWPYSWCLVGCCRQDLFKIAHSILV